MVVLGIPPRTCLEDLSRDRSTLPPLLLCSLCDLLCLRFLLRTVIEDGRAVLRASVHALAILGCGIVHLVEELEQGGILDFLRVEDHLKGFGVCRTKLVAPWLI